MENSEMREHIINLGKYLVEELEQGKHPDTLSQWMINYIAQLITEVEKCTGSEKKKVEKECFNTILKLWEYNSSFPNNKKPFKRFDVIFNTLERLSPDNSNNYFYNNQSGDEEIDDDIIKKYMGVAQAIDEAARVWLENIFKTATELANDEKTRKLLNMALPTKNIDEIVIIKRILDFDNSDDVKSRIDNKIKYLEVRIEQLKRFKLYNEKIYKNFTDQITILKNMLKEEKCE